MSLQKATLLTGDVLCDLFEFCILQLTMIFNRLSTPVVSVLVSFLIQRRVHFRWKKSPEGPCLSRWVGGTWCSYERCKSCDSNPIKEKKPIELTLKKHKRLVGLNRGWETSQWCRGITFIQLQERTFAVQVTHSRTSIHWRIMWQAHFETLV